MLTPWNSNLSSENFRKLQGEVREGVLTAGGTAVQPSPALSPLSALAGTRQLWVDGPLLKVSKLHR